MEPAEHVPDLVFTANAGLVSGDAFVPSHFRHPERQPETPVFAAWFEAAGFELRGCPTELDHEGAGDALPFFDEAGRAVLLSGYRPRIRRRRRAPSWPSCSACPVRSSSWSTSGCTTST